MMFSKSIGIKDSNEAEVLAILEAFCMFVCVHNSKLIVESDSSDAIYWGIGFLRGLLGSSTSFLMRSRHCLH